jgi:cytoskeletal protein CcmA (bactofilin family)
MATSNGALDPGSPSISTIGEDLTIIGNVTSKGQLHLNGQVQGNVHCVALLIGENAQLEGNVVAGDVMVQGRLLGSVHALTVTLQGTSHVEGDLFHKSLSLEQGTYFEGESHPSEDPLASGPEVVAADPDQTQPEIPKTDMRNGFIRSFPGSRSA